ncbi:MAG: deoxyguanosinetriphosphate triphosphohydrolase [Candidatus Fimenecus sp.]
MGESVRETTMKIEKETLSPLACLSENTKGRERPETECDLRTPFQRDRDRILHCNAFRRLKHKTQVFLSPEGDHYRTRLTHTLEVSQIARTIARSMRLNEDLTEAIALGHDLGHTPFGHAGERALDEVFPGGFRHYDQSLRVVDKLEKGGKGLNLTYEVRDGIVCHTCGKEADTLEGRIVKIADKIAYLNHDIDDAVRAGVMRESDIPLDVRETLGDTKSKRINTLVHSVIANSTEDITLSLEVAEAFSELNRFMFKSVYTNPVCKGEESKAEALIKSLYGYYAEHPNELPSSFWQTVISEGAERAACDYVTGMSDSYVLSVYHQIFIPKAWIEKGLY